MTSPIAPRPGENRQPPPGSPVGITIPTGRRASGLVARRAEWRAARDGTIDPSIQAAWLRDNPEPVLRTQRLNMSRLLWQPPSQ
jgi:hypothetical protein